MSSRRDQLLDTALALFTRHGIRATGIDAVLRESGVAKKTLYNHFRSKDDLVLAVLDKRDHEFRAKLRTAVARLAPGQPGDRRLAPVLAFFEGLHEWLSGGGFQGCIFIAAAAEFPAPGPVRDACARHKLGVLHTFEDMLAGLPLADVPALARQLALLADGAIVSAYVAGNESAATDAGAVARTLLEASLAA